MGAEKQDLLHMKLLLYSNGLYHGPWLTVEKERMQEREARKKRKHISMQRSKHKCSEKLYLQLPKTGGKAKAHQEVNEYENSGITLQ